eukprot:m.90917 g.90917  ORF g.90917 m.90917 type:complete len:448 (-) comp13281_c0_seq2:1896-3239(-)
MSLVICEKHYNMVTFPTSVLPDSLPLLSSELLDVSSNNDAISFPPSEPRGTRSLFFVDLTEGDRRLGVGSFLSPPEISPAESLPLPFCLGLLLRVRGAGLGVDFGKAARGRGSFLSGVAVTRPGVVTLPVGGELDPELFDRVREGCGSFRTALFGGDGVLALFSPSDSGLVRGLGVPPEALRGSGNFFMDPFLRRGFGSPLAGGRGVNDVGDVAVGLGSDATAVVASGLFEVKGGEGGLISSGFCGVRFLAGVFMVGFVASPVSGGLSVIVGTFRYGGDVGTKGGLASRLGGGGDGFFWGVIVPDAGGDSSRSRSRSSVFGLLVCCVFFASKAAMLILPGSFLGASSSFSLVNDEIREAMPSPAPVFVVVDRSSGSVFAEAPVVNINACSELLFSKPVWTSSKYSVGTNPCAPSEARIAMDQPSSLDSTSASKSPALMVSSSSHVAS